MLNVGDTIKLGLFSNKEGVPTPLEWVVIKCAGDQARIALKTDTSLFHDYETNGPWKDSSLRAWLNNDIYEGIFSSEEKKCIVDTVVNDDEQFPVFVYPREEDSDPDFDDLKGTIKTEPIVTRDKLTIPQMRDISTAEFVTFNDGYKGIVYKIKEDIKDIITKVWPYCMVLDSFQCVLRNQQDESRNKPIGIYHGSVRLREKYYYSEATFNVISLFGHGSSFMTAIKPLAWINVSEYEKLQQKIL